LKAYLLDDFKVEIDARAAEIGGCWQGEPRYGIPTVWGEDELRFFYERTLECEQPVILDIGANTGAFSLLAAMNPRMRVHAFEPAPITYKVLNNNISLNGLQDRIRTFQVALADRNGATILKYPKSGAASGLACIGKPLRFDEWAEFEVPVRKLDDLTVEHGIEKVDLVKVDTEGCELLVLKGADELIRKCHPDVLCEYWEPNTRQFGYHPSEIAKLLASYGYRHILVSHEDVFFYMPQTMRAAGRKSALLPCVAARANDAGQGRLGPAWGADEDRASLFELQQADTLVECWKSGKTIYEVVLPDCLRESVDRDPCSLPGILRELCDAKRRQEALSLVSYALAKYPDSPDLYNLQAELKYEIGNESGAKEDLLRLIERWPRHAKALNNLGVILGQEGNGREALDCFIGSLAVDPYDRNTVCNCAAAALNAHDVGKAVEHIGRYLDKSPDDAEVLQLSRELAVASSSPQSSVQAVRSASDYDYPQRDVTKVIITSGTLERFNGGAKIYNLWAKLLRKNRVDAYIATQDGSYDKWLVNHEPVISYRDVEDFRRKGDQVRVCSGWLNTPGLERLVGEGQFYYFDAELNWTLQFRDKLDRYLNSGAIARIGTHSRYIQSWYMANYQIKPILINEWSDESVFYEDARERIPGRIGCMPDASPEDRKAFDFLAGKVEEFGRGAELIEVNGDERQVADSLRTVDIFVGLNPGKHPFWGEGCPRTQQEALHCGCVLVAFDCLGNREYLYDNWTGLMSPSGDTEGLWQAVKSLLENTHAKERLRAGGKNIAEGLFSERDKYKLVSSFLGLARRGGLADDARAESAGGMTKEELRSIFPRPFWLAEEEVPFLARAAGDASSAIVEIGCAYGGSTAVFLLNKKRGVWVYSVDPFVPDSKGGVQAAAQQCHDAVAQALLKKGRGEAFEDWRLINDYSQNAAKWWDKEIDLLFIDGSHHYEDVKQDFQQWSRFVGRNGRILIHDSRKDNIAEDPSDRNFSRGWMGPTRLAEELRSSCDFRLVDTCHSISVFARR